MCKAPLDEKRRTQFSKNTHYFHTQKHTLQYTVFLCQKSLCFSGSRPQSCNRATGFNGTRHTRASHTPFIPHFRVTFRIKIFKSIHIKTQKSRSGPPAPFIRVICNTRSATQSNRNFVIHSTVFLSDPSLAEYSTIQRAGVTLVWNVWHHSKIAPDARREKKFNEIQDFCVAAGESWCTARFFACNSRFFQSTQKPLRAPLVNFASEIHTETHTHFYIVFSLCPMTQLFYTQKHTRNHHTHVTVFIIDLDTHTTHTRNHHTNVPVSILWFHVRTTHTTHTRNRHTNVIVYVYDVLHTRHTHGITTQMSLCIYMTCHTHNTHTEAQHKWHCAVHCASTYANATQNTYNFSLLTCLLFLAIFQSQTGLRSYKYNPPALHT